MRATHRRGWLTVKQFVLLLLLLVSSSFSFWLDLLYCCHAQSVFTHYPPFRYRHPMQSTHNESPLPFSLKHATRRSTLSAVSFSHLPFPAVSPFISASLALRASTWAGMLSDKIFPIGILVTLAVAAVLSNLGLAPLSHPLYNLCWTLFLPASLALLLISSSDNNTTESTLNDPRTVETVKTVAIPFFVGSIGSILGCVTSFLICRKWPSLWLSPQNALMAASCLCASYIGGSVNFFATANLLVKNNSQSSLLGSMAAADLIVMAIYFAFLTAALQSKSLLKLFDTGKTTHSKNKTSANDNADNEVEEQNRLPLPHNTRFSLTQTTVATVSVASLAFLIVQVANRVEDILASTIRLPGAACAVIAIVTTLLNQHAPHKKTWKSMQRVAGPLSQICFYLLFASIGTTANVSNALQAGPACLWFSMTALIIHVVVTFGGSLLCKRVFYSDLESQHVLVASNAAIGGPATAGTFCGQIKPRRRGLTLAATVWGVVGYAIGTGIGVSLSGFLSGLSMTTIVRHKCMQLDPAKR